MGVCPNRHWQTSGRLVQELKVCAVGVVGSSFGLGSYAPNSGIQSEMALFLPIHEQLCCRPAQKSEDRLRGKVFYLG